MRVLLALACALLLGGCTTAEVLGADNTAYGKTSLKVPMFAPLCGQKASDDE